MKHLPAYSLANHLLARMRPLCERIEVAGSLRRHQPEVSDIELVLIPKYEERVITEGLFNETRKIRVNLLHEWAISTGAISWIKCGRSEKPYETTVPLAHARQWKGVLPEDIKVDVFITEPKRWGATLLVRTGSADFSTAIAAHAKRVGWPLAEGGLTRAGVVVDTFEERDVFEKLGLAYVEPELRRTFRDVRQVPGGGA